MNRTIRPTALQPKLFSLINHLKNTDDYRVVIDRDNQPMCVLVSFSLWEQAAAERRQSHRDDRAFAQSLKAYYSDMPKEDKEWIDAGILDGSEDED